MHNKDIILIVDDEEINRLILKKYLSKKFTIVEANDGEEAIECINKHETDITAVLLDVIMPKVNGFGVLEFMNEYSYIDAIPVILITADANYTNQLKAFEYGVSDFISKPFFPQIVQKRVKNVIDSNKNEENLRKLVEEQTAYIYEQSQMLREQLNVIEQNSEIMLEGLCTIAEFRSSECGEHISRIKGITRVLYEKYRKLYPHEGITDEEVEIIIRASALHDIGKVAIPDAILLKPGKLTVTEFQEMKKHSAIGVEFLKKFQKISDKKLLEYAAEICMHHHERYDGSGYPDGLVGEEIPLGVQIVSLADVYDALVSKRVYKDAVTSDEAILMITSGKCGIFSDKMLHLLSKSKDEIIKLYH